MVALVGHLELSSGCVLASFKRSLGECEVCTEEAGFPPALALSGTNLELPLYYPP